MSAQLDSWNDGAAKRAIVGFVTRVTTPNTPACVPPADRIAVFDNDGTLWCEQPVIQLAHVLQRWEEMAKETDTRFLIITHHPLTMSRMSRLFGVTMSERGVSQLVSVNLDTAERLRDAS